MGMYRSRPNRKVGCGDGSKRSDCDTSRVYPCGITSLTNTHASLTNLTRRNEFFVTNHLTWRMWHLYKHIGHSLGGLLLGKGGWTREYQGHANFGQGNVWWRNFRARGIGVTSTRWRAVSERQVEYDARPFFLGRLSREE